jgi:hypothetical protein
MSLWSLSWCFADRIIFSPHALLPYAYLRIYTICEFLVVLLAPGCIPSKYIIVARSQERVKEDKRFREVSDYQGYVQSSSSVVVFECLCTISRSGSSE